MRKILGFFAGTVLLASCGKKNDFTNDFGTVLVVNASPSTATAATAMNVYIDTLIKTAAAVTFRGNSGYLGASVGSRTIQTRPANNAAINYINLSGQQIEFQKASTLFVYDTLTSTSTSLRSLLLSDDLSLPASGQVKIRFIHLGVNVASYDVTLLRTNATTPDSVTLSNVSYVGNSPNAATLSAFRAIPAGTYNIRLKNVGTQVVVSQFTGFNMNNPTGFNGIHTLFLSGGSAGQTVGVTRVVNY